MSPSEDMMPEQEPEQQQQSDVSRKMDALLWEKLSEAMAEVFQIARDEMPKLMTFVAVHVAIDRILVYLLAANTLGLNATREQTEAAVSRFADKDTFGEHLRKVRARGLLTPESLEIANAFKDIRNAFLHWKLTPSDRRFRLDARNNDVLSWQGAMEWFNAYLELLRDPSVASLFGPGKRPRLPALEDLVKTHGPVQLRSTIVAHEQLHPHPESPESDHPGGDHGETR